MPVSTGPAIRAVCRMVAGNACGSGSICGLWKGGSLALTNAHVVGDEIGRKVRVEIESKGMKRLTGEVIRAAYDSGMHADWALVHIPGFQEIEPVYLTKKLPPAGYSLYTKGFPKCEKHDGTDITQYRTLNNGVMLWMPNSIGGQSGSGVWGDDDNLQYALLTWSMKYGGAWRGGGQLTGYIYQQNRSFLLTGALQGSPRIPGVEYEEQPCAIAQEPFGHNPIIRQGIYSEPIETGIAEDYPIWAEDQNPEPPPTDPGNPDQWRARGIEFMRKTRDTIDAEIASWEKSTAQPIDPAVPGALDETFGL